MLLQTQLRLDHPAKLQAAKAAEDVRSGAALAQAVANLSANLDEALNRTAILLEAVANRKEGQGQVASLTAEAVDASGQATGLQGGGASWAKDPDDDPPYVMELPSAADVADAAGAGQQPAKEGGNASGDKNVSMLETRTPVTSILHMTKSRVRQRHKDSDNEGIWVVVCLTIAVTLCVCVCASDSPLRRAMEPVSEKVGQTAAAVGPAAPAASAAAQGMADALKP